jgi:alanyl-tRNA synthetase
MKTAAEIRNDFIDFFKNNKHNVVHKRRYEPV